MNDKDWSDLWEEFDQIAEFEMDEEYQNEMVIKHGEGHYFMDAHESWERQKKIIQELVNAKLKEKNNDWRN